MKLYSSPMSAPCRKVRAVIKHLGLNVEVETVDMRSGAHKAPAYLAINPNGKVPALVDGKRTLFESNAIMAYLASRKETPLWPSTDERYDIMQWLSWESCHFAQAVAKIVGQVIYAPMRGLPADPKQIELGLEEFRRFAAVANAKLETSPFLVGTHPTLADFAVAVWVGFEKPCQLPVSEYPQLNRWWQAMQALPGGEDLAFPQKA